MKENVLVYLFYFNFYDIICRSFILVVFYEREVEWFGDFIIVRKYCFYIFKDNSIIKSINYFNLYLYCKKF